MSGAYPHGAVLDCTVRHARAGDLAYTLAAKLRYLALPLSAFEAGELPLKPDRLGLWQIRRRDYGARDGSSLQGFAERALAGTGLPTGEITLITLPRSLFYGFNPVSFWLVQRGAELLAVLAEVSNTFGERHCYLIRHPDNRPILPEDWLAGEKLFHVSPFLPRSGRYLFRFQTGQRFGAFVTWESSGQGEGRSLVTSLTGHASPLALAPRLSLTAPLQGLRVMALILWHGARIFARLGQHHRKPAQLPQTLTQTGETDVL